MTINETLDEALGNLDGAGGELVLDFSSVNRIDSSALRSLETLAAQADAKSVKLVLSGVPVTVYKVLKLAKLGGRTSVRAGL